VAVDSSSTICLLSQGPFVLNATLGRQLDLIRGAHKKIQKSFSLCGICHSAGKEPATLASLASSSTSWFWEELISTWNHFSEWSKIKENGFESKCLFNLSNTVSKKFSNFLYHKSWNGISHFTKCQIHNFRHIKSWNAVILLCSFL
jgi:hypothetical protein